jgi:excinuclease ABC subunit A
VGDFGRFDWEWLGIWLLRFSVAQASSPIRDLLATQHNLDVIRCADWIIDLGPEGGDKGGEIVVCGTPEEVAEHPSSHTGRYLKKVLEQHPPEVVAA